jgi:hypothetical protein
MSTVKMNLYFKKQKINKEHTGGVNMKKRWLGIILSLAILFSVLPVPVLAGSGTDALNYTAFSDDFSDQTVSDAKWSASPSIANGAAVIAPMGKPAPLSIRDLTFGDAEYDFTMSVNSSADWVGFLFNRANVGDTWDNSGYMIFMRSGHESGTTPGHVDFLKASGKESAPSVSGQVPNYTSGEAVSFRVRYESGHITVYAKGEKIIDVTDSDPYSGGYAGFYCCGSAGSGSVRQRRGQDGAADARHGRTDRSGVRQNQDGPGCRQNLHRRHGHLQSALVAARQAIPTR